MTTTINNKLMKIGNYFIKKLLLHYVKNNEDCELQTIINAFEFIIKYNLPDMMIQYYLKHNEENLLKEVVKYYMENTEEFFKFLDIFYSNETTKKMCKEFLKEEEEFDKCLKEFSSSLEKLFFFK